MLMYRLTDVSTHRHFNPLFQVMTLQSLDTSTHDTKTFQPLPVQTFQPMFWTFSTHTCIFFDPFRPLFLKLVNPNIGDVSNLIKPVFTGNNCDMCRNKNVYTVKTLCLLNVLDNDACSPNEVWICCIGWLDMIR